MGHAARERSHGEHDAVEHRASAPEPVFRALLKAVLAAAAVVIALWFLARIRSVLLLLFLALVLAIPMNAAVTWLERRRIRRVIGAIGVFMVAIAVITALLWLVGPRLAEEAVNIVNGLPEFAEGLSARATDVLEGYPALQERVRLNDDNLAQIAPQIMDVLGLAWGWALSLLGLVVILIVLVSLILYMVINPRPLLQVYIRSVPEPHREAATRAFTRSSRAVVGWMYSNLIVGAIEALAVFLFLSWLDVPGALVWASLALFAELVPKLGPYLMAIPPVLVALSIDSMTALWVILFYWLMNELMGDLVMPRIRASTMDLHPVFTLSVALAMLAAFGLIGALVATPLAGFIKAYYDEFYLAHRAPVDESDACIEGMLQGRS